MQTGSTTLTNTLLQASSIPCSLRLIAEWNQNRYAGISKVANAGSTTDFNTDLYPINSIVEAARPKQGMMKARATDINLHTSGIEGFATPDFVDTPPPVRFYTVSESSKYKYWCSPTLSDSSGNFTNVQPYVIYETSSWINKIVVGFEASVITPTNFTIQTTTDGTTWTTVATNVTLTSDGRAIIYLQNNGTWTTTANYNNSIKVLGIRLNVTKVNIGLSFLSLIELSGRLEQDLSAYIISDSDQFEQSNLSFVAPIGEASSNSATVTLSNTDGRFDNDRQWLDYPTNTVPNLLYGLIDKFVRFKVDVGFDTTAFAGSGTEYVRQFTMYSSEWSGEGEDTVEVDLVDSSVILQNTNPSPIFYQNMTAGELIWRLCENIGFSDYNYAVSSTKAGDPIPFYWTDGSSQTVWDCISDISQGTQTAVYFDEFNVLQIKARDVAYDTTQSVKWTFDATAVDAGMVSSQGRPSNEIGKLPDLVGASTNYSFEANEVNVSYKTASISDFQNGFPIMETVWEPDDTVVLRADALYSNLLLAGTEFKINPVDVVTWPYSGFVQIETEIMQYSTKQYSYIDPSFVAPQRKFIASDDEKKALDKISGSKAYLNAYTGYIGGLTRGVWNTTASDHLTTPKSYTGHYRTSTGTSHAWNSGIVPGASTLSLHTNSNFGLTTWYSVKGPNNPGGIPNYIGTRLKFPSTGYKDGIAGLYWSAGTNDSGYYVEITRTAEISTFASGRANQQELNFYVRNSDGTFKRYGANKGTGVPVAISSNTWYDLDVYCTWSSTAAGGTRSIQIALNGVIMMTVNLAAGQGVASEALTPAYGIFARGFTFADFEYLYATNLINGPSFDSEGIIDEISGGYQSPILKDIVYQYRSNSGGTQTYSSQPIKAIIGSLSMDEFGAIAHEVRDYDVKFSKSPVVHSRIYLTNTSQVICPNYVGNPFGASFTIANTSRVNAIVEGEDTLTFGIDNEVDQKILIYGRTVNQDDVASVTVTDQDAIYRRGKVSLTIDSDWIQSKDVATSIGSWITANWAGGNDEITLETFGNPLIQIGDLVAINYPDKSMFRTTHKYFVSGKTTSFDQGYGASLTLRRARI